MISKHTAKVGDTIRIVGLAPDSDGKPDPSEQRYIGKEGVVEYIDSRDILHGTWGGIGLLVVDSYKIIKKGKG